MLSFTRGSFDLDHAFFLINLLFCRLWNLDVKYSVVDISFDGVFVCIIGEKKCLAELGECKFFSEISAFLSVLPVPVGSRANPRS